MRRQSPHAWDADLFAPLVAEHAGAMLRVAFVVCGDRDVAQDAVQNAWTRAWSGRHRLRDVSQARPWLLKIAANEARRASRRERAIRIRQTAWFSNRRGPPATIERDAAIDLGRALRAVSAEDRELLALRYIGDLTTPEMAALTGRTAGAIRVRLHRAHARLRQEIGNE